MNKYYMYYMDHTNAVLTFATGGCSITDEERNEGRRATSMQKKKSGRRGSLALRSTLKLCFSLDPAVVVAPNPQIINQTLE